MKMAQIVPIVFSLITLAPAAFAQSDPRITSWLTTYSGQYARIYTNNANRLANISQTTWTNTGGTIVQSLPTYCSVSEVSYSATWVYFRSTGLGSHIMGPWVNGNFPNLPKNQAVLYRIPRVPVTNGTHALTGLGAIGYFVDGVAMFDGRDAFSYTSGSGNPGSEPNPGSGYWNRDAWVNESATFDPALAHQPGSGAYHYHANAIGLRYLLGDNINFDSVNRTYAENTANTNLKHSPIIGWVRDGFPIYGPYGYSNALDPNSPVIRMRSGFTPRDQSVPSVTNRTSYPLWAVRVKGLASTNLTTDAGPQVVTNANANLSRQFGRYLEDNDYLGDLFNAATGSNYVQGREFDLNEYNVRFCVTPEFPGGTNVYFTCINAAGSPVFPYNIGRQFYGTAQGNNVASITEAVTTNFSGGTKTALTASAPAVNATNSNVTLTWSSIDGGTYVIEATTNLMAWSAIATNLPAAQTNTPTPRITRSVIDTNAAAGTDSRFYRVRLTATNAYDSAGFAP